MSAEIRVQMRVSVLFLMRLYGPWTRRRRDARSEHVGKRVVFLVDGQGRGVRDLGVLVKDDPVRSSPACTARRTESQARCSREREQKETQPRERERKRLE